MSSGSYGLPPFVEGVGEKAQDPRTIKAPNIYTAAIAAAVRDAPVRTYLAMPRLGDLSKRTVRQSMRAMSLPGTAIRAWAAPRIVSASARLFLPHIPSAGQKKPAGS